MEADKQLVAVHPVVEGQFTFSTAGGRVRLAVTEDAVTPYGRLVPWVALGPSSAKMLLIRPVLATYK